MSLYGSLKTLRWLKIHYSYVECIECKSYPITDDITLYTDYILNITNCLKLQELEGLNPERSYNLSD